MGRTPELARVALFRPVRAPDLVLIVR